jgi:glycosyltransferase 2 family protein
VGLSWKRLKPLLRWLILGAVLFFLLTTLANHWGEVAKLRIDAAGIACLAIAIGVTLFAHIFAGYVWAWILKLLSHPVSGAWGAKTYLITNIAKYLPGNVWHFYGRVSAATKLGIPIETATLSIFLELLLMASAGCCFALVGVSSRVWLQVGVAIAILIGIHPRCLNPVLKQVSKLKKSAPILQLETYPLIPLLGELGFLGLRAIGFILTVLALRPVNWGDIPLLWSAFSWAWLVGLVTPGFPGGVGVFEVVAVTLLSRSFPSGEILAIVALYRLVNTLAEGLGAGLAVIDDRLAQD